MQNKANEEEEGLKDILESKRFSKIKNFKSKPYLLPKSPDEFTNPQRFHFKTHRNSLSQSQNDYKLVEGAKAVNSLIFDEYGT